MLAEFSVELLAVWIAIEDYKHTDSQKERQPKLTAIKERFLTRGSPEEINITSELRDATLQAIESTLLFSDPESSEDKEERNVLNRLQNQIESTIQIDTLPRFKKAANK